MENYVGRIVKFSLFIDTIYNFYTTFSSFQLHSIKTLWRNFCIFFNQAITLTEKNLNIKIQSNFIVYFPSTIFLETNFKNRIRIYIVYRETCHAHKIVCYLFILEFPTINSIFIRRETWQTRRLSLLSRESSRNGNGGNRYVKSHDMFRKFGREKELNNSRESLGIKRLPAKGHDIVSSSERFCIHRFLWRNIQYPFLCSILSKYKKEFVITVYIIHRFSRVSNYCRKEIRGNIVIHSYFNVLDKVHFKLRKKLFISKSFLKYSTSSSSLSPPILINVNSI